MAEYDWDEIETEIQSLYLASPSNLQKGIMPGAYQPGSWKYTTAASVKRPCICCGELPREMAVLTATMYLHEVEPVCMCIAHQKQWKDDPRTKKRLLEEQDKYRKKIQHNLTGGRPRNPEGWQIDAEEIIAELNETVSTLAFDVPMISGLPDNQAIERLKDVKRLQQLMQGVIDQAKIAMVLRDMKRPPNAAYNPEEVRVGDITS